MATPVLQTLRDRLALGHLKRCQALNKTCDVLSATGSPITGWSGLYCVKREMTHREIQRYLISAETTEIDCVFEIARQGTFTGIESNIMMEPHRYKIKFGGLKWEIVQVKVDDVGFVSTVETPAIYLIYCKRWAVGLGELPR